jgi:hypothetical protein
MDFIQLLIFSAVFILLSLMFQVFAVKVLNLPKPVKKQKPINGTHRIAFPPAGAAIPLSRSSKIA